MQAIIGDRQSRERGRYLRLIGATYRASSSGWASSRLMRAVTTPWPDSGVSAVSRGRSCSPRPSRARSRAAPSGARTAPGRCRPRPATARHWAACTGGQSASRVVLRSRRGAHQDQRLAIPSSSRWNSCDRAGRSGRGRGMLTLVPSSSSRSLGAAGSGDDVGGSVMPSPAPTQQGPLGSDSSGAIGSTAPRPNHPATTGACTSPRRFHLVLHYRVMSRCGPLPTVGHMRPG